MEIKYNQTGQSTTVNELGMREMQVKVYAVRDRRLILLKAPPASGKSRALMFIALHKLAHQGIKRVVIAVPEKSIGRSFLDTKLTPAFFEDWKVGRYFNLCDVGQGADESQKVLRLRNFCQGNLKSKVLVCTHATLRFALQELDCKDLNDTFFGIDEFHHTSADANNGLGALVHRLITETNAHIMAMTGSYFRGDGVPVLLPEDENKFTPITYNYYDQLNGYTYLKSLGLGYHFYQGHYLTAISKVVDTRRKTLIHIPAVQSRATGSVDKYEQTQQIIDMLGTTIEHDYNNALIHIRDQYGERRIVADLVDDDTNHRNRVQAYLQRMKRPTDVDIIIALGTAKEGFDWPWCEQCVTIGVRGSLTEVIQIIGRCTRDCEGKEHAQFTNLIAAPDAEQDEVQVAVNDMLKAITASLLMEQVMNPSWNFKTKASPKHETTKEDILKKTLVVEGLRSFKNPELADRYEEDKNDIKAGILQHPLWAKSLSDKASPEVVNKVILPRIIAEQYPQYAENDDDLEAVRQRIQLDFVTKTAEVTEDTENPGNTILKVAGRFVKVKDLSISLIDSINPFQRCYEIMSRDITAPVLKVIQDTIADRRMNMTTEEAVILYKGAFQEYKAAHDGKYPSLQDPDPNVRRLAEAFNYLKHLKIRREMGLEYNK